MRSGLVVRAGVLVIGVALLSSLAVQSQEHVRLVPQLGVGDMNCVAYSQDDRFVLTGSDDSSPRLWDAATGQQIRSFVGHKDEVKSVAFSSDSRFVLTGSKDQTARLWDVTTGRQIQIFQGHEDAVSSVAISPDGRFVLTGSWDNTARLWNAATGQQIRTLTEPTNGGATDGVTSVAFSKDGKLVATGSDKAARLWNPSTGQLIRSFEIVDKDVGEVDSLAFAPNGRFILTGGVTVKPEAVSGTVTLWDLATGQQIRTFVGHTREVRSVAFSKDGQYVLTGSEDDTARLWDASTGEQLRSFQFDEWVSSVAFSPDERFVLAGVEQSQRARLFELSTGRLIREFVGHTTSVFSVAYSHDGRFIVIANADETARVLDTTTGQQVNVLQGLKSGVTDAVISQDSRLVLTGGYESPIRVWDRPTGQQVRSLTLPPPSAHIPSAAFSPDNRFVIAASQADQIAWLLNATTGEQVQVFEGHEGGITSVAYSRDGRFVLTGSLDKTARIWDAGSGQQILVLRGHEDGVTSVAFSPDGHFVLTGSRDKTARVWDASTGQQIHSLQGHTGSVNSVAFSPDGRSILTGSLDKTVRLWDAAAGNQMRSFEGHTDSINSVTFSADGKLILSGSSDKTARLWDANTGEWIRSLEGATGAVNSVAYAPDGRFILTGNADKTVRGWNPATGQQIGSSSGYTGSPQSLSISLDGRSLLVGSRDSIRLENGTSNSIRVLQLPAPASTQMVTSLALSPDGQTVLAGSSNNTAQLWDVYRGTLRHSFRGHTEMVTSVAFSSVGNFVLTGSGDKTARLWDAATGKQVRSFEGHTETVTSVASSPDGKFVLTGSLDKTARLWDAATGKQIRSFEGHTDAVKSVAFSSDGKLVLTGSLDHTARMWDTTTGQQVRLMEASSDLIDSAVFSPDTRFVLTGSGTTAIRLWDTASGRLLATLLNTDDGGWVVTDPQGRYDSNDPENSIGLAWATDSNRVIELRQLKDNYYTPNLLASIIKGERLPDVKGLNLVPAPPEVAIASPNQPESSRLSLSITNQGGGVGRIVVSVNDRKVATLDHPLAGIAASKKSNVTVDLSTATLIPGENTIKVYAFDAGNQIRSHEAVATFTIAAKARGVTPEGDDSMAADYKPQFYGIVVGTSSFAGDHAIDLQYPAHDAESMMTGLEIGAGKLFGSENAHLHLLTTDAKDESGQPTKANIVAAFADVAKKAKPKDVLLVYLSGHGVNLRTEKDSYYYLTTDARSLEIENNQALRGLSTVSSVELRNWMGAKNMPLKEVLILDTCAAGAANEELLKLVEKRDVPPDQRRAVEFLKDATGTIILMGSAADKVSYEASKYGQGLLTYALLEGMKGRSIEEGSRLNVSHWFQNASEDVTQLAQSIGGVQKPVIAAPSGTGFPVALLDPVDQARIPLAAIKPELLHLSCHDDHDHDPLGLATIVREQLREISHPSVRGQEAEPPVVYHDDMNDGPADSLTPKIVYSVSGSMVTLNLRIDQEDNTIKEDTLTLSSADKSLLASAIAAKLVAMAGQVPLQGVKQ
jgi:WD40 repeat protein